MDESIKDKLGDILEKEENEHILKLTRSKIKEIKNNNLQKLQLGRENLKKIHKQLENYRYVDDISNLRYGFYIRWINLKNTQQIKLTNGAIICDIKVVNDEVHIVCKNNMNRFMQLKLEECYIFQKLSDQEPILLSVMESLKN